jgi:hypothetical protein
LKKHDVKRWDWKKNKKRPENYPYQIEQIFQILDLRHPKLRNKIKKIKRIRIKYDIKLNEIK